MASEIWTFDCKEFTIVAKLVTGLDFQSTKESDFCEGCAQDKQKRAPFPKEQATRASEILGIIHSDVCGPMQENSLGGNKYFVTFIDDKSRFTEMYICWI